MSPLIYKVILVFMVQMGFAKCLENEESVTIDLENWMTNLPRKLRAIPINQLAIPGSHDSGTYSLTIDSDIAPDADPLYKQLEFLGPLLKASMVRWSVTQTKTITIQLNYGIRYFDLRIAPKSGEFLVVHGLYGVSIKTMVDEMNDFLGSHPKEIIIIDCQHFYAFTQNDHTAFINMLSTTFADKLMPYTSDMANISLDYMTSQFSYQVIVVYRDNDARLGQSLLWSTDSFPTPWANTVSIPKLIDFLTDGLKKKNNSIGFISQPVLIADTAFLLGHLASSLIKELVIPLEGPKIEWLKDQMPGPGGINIVISDDIVSNDGEFPREVVRLNDKLI